MRILYIVTAFPRGSSDVITPWLVATIERLRERGVEVEVLAPSYRGLGDQVVNGVPVHRFRYAPSGLEALTHDQTAPDRIREKPASLALVPGYVAAGSLAAARLARTGRFDVVHAFWPIPHGLLALAAARAGGIPMVSTFFGVELTWVRRRLPFLAPLLRWIVRKSDAVTVISSHTAAEVRRFVPGARLHAIPFGAAMEVEEAADRSRPHEGDYRVLFVGRLVERKGVGVLLEAISRLPNDDRVRLTVVGGGPMRGEWESEAKELGIADRVEFAGVIGGDELVRRFRASDVLVLPAVEDSKGDVEGLGVVLIEAMQHGLPVIASRSGGIPDIVRDNETGILVSPGDPAALGAAIHRLVADDALAARLATAGQRYVADRFSWRRIIDELIDVYTEVSQPEARAHSGAAR